MNKKVIIVVAVAVAAVLIAGLSFVFFRNADAGGATLRYTAVSRGNVSRFISATGTIEPVTEVEVGTQVSGIIDKIYVDYNSPVVKGQLLAEMDRVTLESELSMQQASYDGALAEYNYQQQLYDRNSTLYAKDLISDAEFEESTYNYKKSKAALAQAEASLAKAKRNLSYATITSPIDGVVTSRSVEEGQTVASGFETPTLFTIAADLTQMRVVADVDEADIAGVEEGNEVEFTVDAYPDDVFHGTVQQVRLGSTASSTSTSSTSTTVVTYEVVISAPNPDLKLKPRLTATATIFTEQHRDVPVVPGKALRFKPTPDITGKMPIVDCEAENKLWTLAAGTLTAVPVETGLSSGGMTEIVSGIEVGTQVVAEAVGGVVAMPAVDTPATETNPFMPGPPKRK